MNVILEIILTWVFARLVFDQTISSLITIVVVLWLALKYYTAWKTSKQMTKMMGGMFNVKGKKK